MTTPGSSADKAAQDAVEGRARERSGKGDRSEDDGTPSAGPHADPALINPEATPGAGTLPSPGDDDGLESTGG